jgi:hypothetical protein
MYIKKNTQFSIDQLIECQLQMHEVAQKLVSTPLFNFQDLKLLTKEIIAVLKDYTKSSTNPWSTCYKGPIQHLGETLD